MSIDDVIKIEYQGLQADAKKVIELFIDDLRPKLLIYLKGIMNK